MKLPFKPSEYRKALVAATAFGSILVSEGVLHGTTQSVVVAALAAAGTVGVTATRNADAT